MKLKDFPGSFSCRRECYDPKPKFTHLVEMSGPNRAKTLCGPRCYASDLPRTNRAPLCKNCLRALKTYVDPARVDAFLKAIRPHVEDLLRGDQ